MNVRVHEERFASVESPHQRLICVENRLPFTASRDDSAEWHLKKSSGGLASALGAVENLHMTQVGWPGAEIPIEKRESLSNELSEHLCIPVYLSHSEIELYYNGFSNGVLWPLFHYVTPALITGSHEAEWNMYMQVNRMFAEEVARVLAEQGDKDTLVWIHDYHLMLVPRFLRELVPDANIGFFLHTPFPAADLFRMLPYREEVIHGLLSSNYLAFQTREYCRHFLSAVSQLTNLQVTENNVDALPIGGALVACGHVPIGIDPEPFIKASTQNEVVIEKIFDLREQYGTGRKIILGVDRLDYMKGIQHKLQAYEKFLDNHPEWVGNCVLVQLAVPSRGECKDYQRLRKHVHELVGQLCGKHSHLTSGPPVLYLDQAIDFQGLVALYRAADVMLVTSIRDGMNLVAFEYIACHQDSFGVLVLSEFTGAMQSMGGGALRVNPWNIDESSEVIHSALTMSEEERRTRHQFCFEYICSHTAQRWAETFLENLRHAVSETEAIRASIPPRLPVEEIISNSVRRLMVFDLIDCLVSSITASGRPLVTHPDFGALPFDVKKSFESFLFDSQCVVIVSTPHRRELMDCLWTSWVGGRTCSLILLAENGCVFKSFASEATRHHWTSLVAQEEEGPFISDEWRSSVRKFFEFLQDQNIGSYLEESEMSLKWFAQTPGSTGAALIQHSAGPVAEPETEIVVADRYIEIRPKKISLSTNLNRLLHHEEIYPLVRERMDMCLSIGAFPYRDDDVYGTLEDTLKTMWSHRCLEHEEQSEESRFVSVCVGHAKLSKANYSLPTRYHVHHLLADLAESYQRARGA
jgi:trehalose 6-phosphate synthase/phosphatase